MWWDLEGETTEAPHWPSGRRMHPPPRHRHQNQHRRLHRNLRLRSILNYSMRTSHWHFKGLSTRPSNGLVPITSPLNRNNCSDLFCRGFITIRQRTDNLRGLFVILQLGTPRPSLTIVPIHAYFMIYHKAVVASHFAYTSMAISWPLGYPKQTNVDGRA